MVRRMAKPLKAGGEIDSWCTKCKLVLNHRIIAMVGSVPARVECSTCSSHHNYRARAPGEKAPAASARGSRASASTSALSSSGPRSSRSPAAKVQQAALDREKAWEKAIAGKAVRDFRPYRVSERFSEGELIQHSKFGEGVVTRLIEGNKLEILFKDDTRVLAHCLTM